MKKQIIILAVTALVVLGGAVLLFINGNGVPPAEVGKPVDESKLLRDSSHSTGKLDAKVVVVEFGDYQCPACATVNPFVKQLIAENKDNPNFSFVFRNFPLAMHPNAKISAQAAEAAGEQGKFWEMHDMLYEKQSEWANSFNPIDAFAGYAQGLGLDAAKFKQAVSGNKFSSVIEADYNDGTDLGVNSTPTFYVNGEKFTFKSSYQELIDKVKEELAK
jgi:protein-disulfide isomerase